METEQIAITENSCDFEHACLPFSLPSSVPVCHTKDKSDFYIDCYKKAVQVVAHERMKSGKTCNIQEYLIEEVGKYRPKTLPDSDFLQLLPDGTIVLPDLNGFEIEYSFEGKVGLLLKMADEFLR